MRRIGRPAAIAIGCFMGWLIVMGLEEAMHEDQDIVISLINIHIYEKGPVYDGYYERLKRVAHLSAIGTIYSEAEQASFLPSYTRTGNFVGEEGVQDVENRFANDVHEGELQYELLHHGKKLEAP